MSIAGIAASGFFSGAIAQSSRNRLQQVQQEFQRLSQDLEAGNLAQAQTDLTTLRKDLPGGQGAGQSDSRAAQPGWQQLAQDLRAGNLTAARSDFANLKQDAQGGSGPAIHPHRHARHGEDSGSSANGIAQVLSQLGQALQSNNISAAQQSYSTLLEEFQAAGGTGLNPGLATTAGAVSVSA